jgi:acyl phosphate:glycerol-3-phosphate acyltransferase
MHDLTLSLTLMAVAVGYFLGSIPFGLVLSRLAGLGDVRDIGSGNIGATNVLRTGSKSIAALTLLADILKGTAAVVVACAVATSWMSATGPAATASGVVAGLAAFLGHLFPAWLNFQGGKGVATYLGVVLGAAPLVALGFALCWLLTAFVSRYSSLAALIASIATPMIAFVLDASFALISALVVMTVLLIWRHQDNIRRLLSGEESKIGKTAS